MWPKDNPPWQVNFKATTETEDDIGFATFGREAFPQQISNPPSENPHNDRCLSQVVYFGIPTLESQHFLGC